MSSKKKDKKEKEKKEKDKTTIKLKHKPSKSKLIIGSSKQTKPERAASETGQHVTFANVIMPPRARSTSIGVQRIRKTTDPESIAEPPTPDASSMSNSEGKSPDVLRKAVAELAELENLIDDCESDPAVSNTADKNHSQMPEDDEEFVFDTTLDFERKVDFLSQLAEDFATNLPEDVERAFEEVITALQTKDSEDILGLTADNVVDDMNGVDYDSYIDSIIQHTQEIDLSDEDEFKFDMKIEGLDEYRRNMAMNDPNDLEQVLMDIDTSLPAVVMDVPAERPRPNLPDISTEVTDADQVGSMYWPYKSPEDSVDAVSSPRVLSPKKVTPTESMDKPSSPSRVITPRQMASPRHSVEDIPPIEITAPKTPREPETTDNVTDGTDVEVEDSKAKHTPREVESDHTVLHTPRDPMPRRESAEPTTPPQTTPRDLMPQQDTEEHHDTPEHTPRQPTPRQDSSNTPRQVVENGGTTPREQVKQHTPREEIIPGDAPLLARTIDSEVPHVTGHEEVEVSSTAEQTQDEHSSNDSDSSDSDSSSEEQRPLSPKADETRTASGNLKVPLIPVQNAQQDGGDNGPLTTTRNSGKTSRRGSTLTAVDKQKIIDARREATLKMAQQLRDELKSSTADPVTKRQRLAQLLNEFKGVQVKGLINIFEQKMKEVVKK